MPVRSNRQPSQQSARSKKASTDTKTSSQNQTDASRRLRGKFGAQKVELLLERLKQTYPYVVCALTHRNAYELLVATILSAQCTDERVNRVTPTLFLNYPDPESLAQAEQEDVEQVIHSLGFFRAKAANLIGMAKGLVSSHAGVVPDSLEELQKLPGVGRKTANVVLGVWFGLPAGVVVDTHVKRISRLLGLTQENTPEKIERDLQKLLPRSEWIDFSHRLIYHGRKICIARRPRCQDCPLLEICQRTGLPALSS